MQSSDPLLFSLAAGDLHPLIHASAPPANFSDWPPTRIGALVFLGVMPLLLIIPAVRRALSAFFNGWSCCGFLGPLCGPIWVAFLVSFWAHFIPCIWWTCDLSKDDGGAVRGLIWFVGWGVLATLGVLCNVYTKFWLPARERRPEEDLEDGDPAGKVSEDSDEILPEGFGKDIAE